MRSACAGAWSQDYCVDPSIDRIYRLLPVQVQPSPVYPALHVHVLLPIVFAQTA